MRKSTTKTADSSAILFTIFSLLAIGGCSNSQEQDRVTKVTLSEKQAALLNEQGKFAESAEHYAQIGEALMTPTGIKYANDIFDKALSIDKKNVRANVLSSFVKPFLAMRGFIARTAHLDTNSRKIYLITGSRYNLFQPDFSEPEKTSPLKGSHESLINGIANSIQTKRNEYSEMNVFLSNGNTSEIRNYSDLQLFLKNELLPNLEISANRMGEVLKTSENINFLLQAGAWGKTDFSSKYNCKLQGYGWDCYGEIHTWPSKSEQFGIDQHDIKMLRGSFLTMIDSIRLNSAFSLEGLDKVIEALQSVQTKRFEEFRFLEQDYNNKRNAKYYQTQDATDELWQLYRKNKIDYYEYSSRYAQLWQNWNNSPDPDFPRPVLKKLTTRDVVQVLRQQDNLFKINSDQALSKIPLSTSETLKNYIDYAAMDQELCNNPARQHHLISMICITSNIAMDLQLSLDALNGPKEILLGQDLDGEDVRVLMDLRNFINHPPRDLKELLPTKFTKRGDAKTYPDKTLGGLFPNRDLFEKLKAVGHPGAKHVQ